MATIIHIAVSEIDTFEWYAKAESFHMLPTYNFKISYRYIIAKGNVIEDIEAKW